MMTNLKRRRFLKYTGVMSASSWFWASGCASFDSWILGDQAGASRVAIIGGGLAGLTAAYHLKKQKVPYIVFEGSSRLGGRLKTIYNLSSSGGFAELGGEWVSPDHSHLRQLCRELRLDLNESTFKEDKVLSRNLRSFLRSLALKKIDGHSRSLLESVSLEEFLRKESISSVEKALLLKSAEVRFGVSANEIPAQFLYDAYESKIAPFLPFGIKLYRFSGGSSSLIEALRENIEGVIPQRQLQFQTKLVDIEKREGIFNLTFATPEGRKWIRAKYVIMAMPISLVRQISGLRSLELESSVLNQLDSIQVGHLGKGYFTSSERSKISAGDRHFNAATGIFYHRDQLNFQPPLGSEIIWNFQVGAEKARSLGLGVVKELQTEFPTLTSQHVQAFNWSLNPWSQGAVSFKRIPSPGREKESFQFAGEYMSEKFQGTMNGAIESGEIAAQNMIRLIANNAIA